MTFRPRALAVSLIGVAVGSATLALVPRQIQGASLADGADMRSPAFFPVLAAGVVILASVVDAVRVVTGAAGEREPWSWHRPLVLTVAFLVFLLLVPALGTMTAAFLLMLAISLVFGHPRIGWSLTVALVTTVLIYLLFERLLLVLFPHGRIF